MSKVISAFLFTLLITLVATSPVPSIPLIMLNYKINGILIGYIATLLGGLFAAINQFFLSRKLVLGILKRKFPHKYRFMKKYSNIISRMTYFEFIFLLFSGAIPATIISLASGLSKMKFKKFFICVLLVSIPQQCIFLIAASQFNNIEKLIGIFGLKGFNSVIISLSIVSFFAFMISYIIRLSPEIIKFFKETSSNKTLKLL